MAKRLVTSLFFCLALFSISSRLAAQTAPEPGTFGTTAVSYVRVPSAAFFPVNSADGYTGVLGGPRSGPQFPNLFQAPIQLPSGARPVFLELLRLLERGRFAERRPLPGRPDGEQRRQVLLARGRDGPECRGHHRHAGGLPSPGLPAPGAATFNDVPTNHPFFQFVEALAPSGITAGCGAGNFCPDSPLTRGQMAVFLAKAVGLQWP